MGGDAYPPVAVASDDRGRGAGRRANPERGSPRGECATILPRSGKRGVVSDENTQGKPASIDEKFTHAVIALLKHESERGCMLLGGALLEDLCGGLLVNFLSHEKGRSKKRTVAYELLGPEQPLGTFAARIDMCFAVDLITRNEWSDLHTLRELRNGAAHLERLKKPYRLINTAFGNEVTEAKCRSLKICGDWDKLGGTTTRERFIYIVGVLVALLHWRVGWIQGQRQRGVSRDLISRALREDVLPTTYPGGLKSEPARSTGRRPAR